MYKFVLSFPYLEFNFWRVVLNSTSLHNCYSKANSGRGQGSQVACALPQLPADFCLPSTGACMLCTCPCGAGTLFPPVLPLPQGLSPLPLGASPVCPPVLLSPDACPSPQYLHLEHRSTYPAPHLPFAACPRSQRQVEVGEEDSN